MKNEKFKNYFVAIIFGTAFIACEDQKEVALSESEFVDVSIPETYKTNYSNGRTSSTDIDVHETNVKITKKDGTEIIGKMRFTMPTTEDETLEKFEISNNLFNDTDLSPDFWAEQSKASDSDGRFESSCIGSCQTAFTNEEGGKIKGRGACKAQCWAETAIKAATVIVAIAII